MQASFLELTPSKRLSEGFPKKMVLLDCETTGGRAAYHRIIEVGLICIDDGNVVDTWQTLINPERDLPPFIQNLTGITPNMLVDAPTFSDIAETLLEKLNDRVLVAHNARFDYGFIKNEFSRIGVQYASKPLCSVKFSRTMFPHFRRHGLDQIIKRFNFSILNRHRALDDAQMIHKFFQSSSSLFTADEISACCEQLIKNKTLPALLNPEEVKRLPDFPGVYYFYDQKGVLLYVGKSINIRTRVLSHFSQDHKNHKDLKMSASIAHIDFTLTPTDFGAQLLESQEVKAKQPLFNTRLRKVKKLLQVKLNEDDDGYLLPTLKTVQVDESIANQLETFGLFRSRRQALARFEKLANQFFLCHKLLGLENNNSKHKPCFRFQLKRCLGACCQQESVSQYNERLLTAFKKHKQQAWPYAGPVLIVESGKYDHKSQENHLGFHLVDQWVYMAKLTSETDVYDFGLSPLTNENSDKINTMPYAPQDTASFDLDTYHILVRFLLNPDKHGIHGLTVIPLTLSGQ